MKIRYLMMAAACCALLATGVLLAGCQDTPSRQVPNLANSSVLLYTDSWHYRGALGSARDTPPTGFAGQAVVNLGAVEYDIAYDPGDFDNYLDNSYDLIVIDNSNYGLESYQYDALTNYVENGGRLVICSIDGSYGDFWTALGYSYSYNELAALPVYRWQPSHAIFTFPNAMPDLTAMTGGPSINSAPGNALEGTEAIGGATASPTDGEGQIFVNDSGRTVLNAFLLCNAIDSQNIVPNDVDDDGKPDAVELWENEIAYVMQGNVQPVLLPSLDFVSSGAATKKNMR